MSSERRGSGDGLPPSPCLFRSGLAFDECHMDEELAAVDLGPPPWWDDADIEPADVEQTDVGRTAPPAHDGDAGSREPEWCSARSGPVAWLERYGQERSRLLASVLTQMHTIAHPDGGSRRQDRVGDAIDQIAARLGWSRTMAGTWLTLAEDVVERLPALHMVLRVGALDESERFLPHS